MGRFKMSTDAEFAFRLTVTPSFAAPFVMRVWGAGKWGWFTANCWNVPPVTDLHIPEQRLRKGEWRTLLNHVEQVLLEVQEVERYHWVARHELMEPGLARTINFLLSESTAFEERLACVAVLYFQTVER
ncbi:MAG: hypothetical protein MUF06_15000 [Pirellulaceae bacterium]|nr:hypothetical protein [Pirellulaceae bacterium]